MSDQPLDTTTEPVAGSTPVAPGSDPGGPQGSTPASADTAASEPAKPEGQEPDRQSRRASREFATQRREIRELNQKLGYLQAQLEQRAQPGDGQPEERQTKSPQQIAAERRDAAATRLVVERLEDAGDAIEGFDKVMKTITGDFPITTVMRDYLGESDKPADMAKWLADNPDEAHRISLLTDAVAIRALERAEAKLRTPAPKKTTGAPAPVRTVGGSSAVQADPSKMSMDDYAAWRSKRPS